MTAKLWGGILIGVFVVAAGAEIMRRKCPDCANKISDCTKKAVDLASDGLKSFTKAAKKSFTEGYSSI